MKQNETRAGEKGAPYGCPKPRSMDRRARKTRAALTAALLTLLKEKPVRTITVTELTELADVNRATFYVHYQDVYDLYGQMKEDTCLICQDIIRKHADEIAAERFQDFFEDLFSELALNADLADVAFGEYSDGSLLGEIIDTVRTHCFEALDVNNIVKSTLRAHDAARDRDADLCAALCSYQFDFMAGGVINILKSWIRGGKREPVRVVAAIAGSYLDIAHKSMIARNMKTIEAMGAWD